MQWRPLGEVFGPWYLKIVFWLTIVGIGIVYLGKFLRWLGWVH